MNATVRGVGRFEYNGKLIRLRLSGRSRSWRRQSDGDLVPPEEGQREGRIVTHEERRLRRLLSRFVEHLGQDVRLQPPASWVEEHD